jgi:hypothetical protein
MARAVGDFAGRVVREELDGLANLWRDLLARRIPLF